MCKLFDVDEVGFLGVWLVEGVYSEFVDLIDFCLLGIVNWKFDDEKFGVFVGVIYLEC